MLVKKRSWLILILIFDVIALLVPFKFGVTSFTVINDIASLSAGEKTLLCVKLLLVLLTLPLIMLLVKTNNEIKEERTISSLNNYIYQCRTKGFSDEEIRDKLVGVGWKDEVVDSYLK